MPHPAIVSGSSQGRHSAHSPHRALSGSSCKAQTSVPSMPQIPATITHKHPQSHCVTHERDDSLQYSVHCSNIVQQYPVQCCIPCISISRQNKRTKGTKETTQGASGGRPAVSAMDDMTLPFLPFLPFDPSRSSGGETPSVPSTFDVCDTASPYIFSHPEV